MYNAMYDGTLIEKISKNIFGGNWENLNMGLYQMILWNHYQYCIVVMQKNGLILGDSDMLL